DLCDVSVGFTGVSGETVAGPYHYLHPGVSVAHLVHERAARAHDIRCRRARADDVHRPEVQRGATRRIILHPPDKEPVIRNIYSLEPWMTLMVAVVIEIVAGRFGAPAAHEVDRVALRLELLA